MLENRVGMIYLFVKYLKMYPNVGLIINKITWKRHKNWNFPESPIDVFPFLFSFNQLPIMITWNVNKRREEYDN